MQSSGVNVMLKKIIVFISTDIEDLESYDLYRLLQEDVVDYEVEDLTEEEREEFD